MIIDPADYEEVVRRLVSLRDAIGELAEAYTDPVAKRGAEEMHASLERILELLGHST